MQFDWTTFVLEIVNFLVLVWILQRFLYRPVTEVIARRTAEVETRLADAQKTRAEAQALKLQLEDLATQAGRDKESARAKLQEEMAVERGRRLEALDASLLEEGKKRRTLEQQQLDELRRQARDEALGMAGIFVARLLSRLRSAELEATICQVVVEDFNHLAESDARVLRTAGLTTDPKARVTSAYALNQDVRDALGVALSRVAGRSVTCEFDQDAHLVAGLRITLGSWIVRANLNDELRMFVEAERHAA